MFCRYVFALFQEKIHPPPQRNDADDNQHTIPTFLTLYIFGFVYELVLAYDALRLKNTIQIIGLCLYNLGLLIYAAVQMSEIDDAVYDPSNNMALTTWSAMKPFLIAIPCVIAVGSIAMSIVARKIYDEFAWTIYKHISADLRMKRRYLAYQVQGTAWKSSAQPADLFLDLYRPAQVRLLLLPWIYRAVRGGRR